MSAKAKNNSASVKKTKNNPTPIKIRPIDIVAVILLTMFAFSTRLFNLGLPQEYYFDEIYYVEAAKSYKQLKKDPNWVHPPLAKILIAQGSILSSKDFFRWRIAGLLLGCLMIPLVYFLAFYMFKSTLASSLAAFFLSIDFLHFAQSRIATLDIFLAFFMLVSAFFLWFSINKKEFDIIYFYLSAVFSGLACACKWSGIFSVFFAVAIVLLYHRKSFFKNIFIYILLLLITYFITYIPYFFIGGTVQGLYKLFVNTLKFQYKGDWTHHYMSPLWKWPLLLRPIWYFYEKMENARCSGIIAFGNPLFWYPFFVFFAVSVYRAIFLRVKEDCFLALGYIFSFIFWIFSNRGGFFYYMTPAVVWMTLITVGYLSKIKLNPFGKVFLYGYIAFVFFAFCVYYPYMTAIPMPSKSLHLLFFMRFWI